jgi:hypothetical protein
VVVINDLASSWSSEVDGAMDSLESAERAQGTPIGFNSAILGTSFRLPGLQLVMLRSTMKIPALLLACVPSAWSNPGHASVVVLESFDLKPAPSSPLDYASMRSHPAGTLWRSRRPRGSTPQEHL